MASDLLSRQIIIPTLVSTRENLAAISEPLKLLGLEHNNHKFSIWLLNSVVFIFHFPFVFFKWTTQIESMDKFVQIEELEVQEYTPNFHTGCIGTICDECEIFYEIHPTKNRQVQSSINFNAWVPKRIKNYFIKCKVGRYVGNIKFLNYCNEFKI